MKFATLTASKKNKSIFLQQSIYGFWIFEYQSIIHDIIRATWVQFGRIMPSSVDHSDILWSSWDHSITVRLLDHRVIIIRSWWDHSTIKKAKILKEKFPPYCFYNYMWSIRRSSFCLAARIIESIENAGTGWSIFKVLNSNSYFFFFFFNYIFCYMSLVWKFILYYKLLLIILKFQHYIKY